MVILVAKLNIKYITQIGMQSTSQSFNSFRCLFKTQVSPQMIQRQSLKIVQE